MNAGQASRLRQAEIKHNRKQHAFDEQAWASLMQSYALAYEYLRELAPV